MKFEERSDGWFYFGQLTFFREEFHAKTKYDDYLYPHSREISLTPLRLTRGVISLLYLQVFDSFYTELLDIAWGDGEVSVGVLDFTLYFSWERREFGGWLPEWIMRDSPTLTLRLPGAAAE